MTLMILALYVFIKVKNLNRYVKIPVENLSQVSLGHSGWNVLFTKLQEDSHSLLLQNVKMWEESPFDTDKSGWVFLVSLFVFV